MNPSIFRKEISEIATKLATLNVAAQDMGLAESDRDHLDYLLSSSSYLVDQASAMAGKLLVESLRLDAAVAKTFAQPTDAEVAQLTDSDRAQADEAGRRA